MKLTVVIPTLNRLEYVVNTVNYLLQQSWGDFEVLVIDQSDSDLHRKLIGSGISRENVRIIRQEEKSASKARNNGLLQARGEITLFLDDDVIINKTDFLYNHIRHYDDPDLSGVAGAILNPNQNFRNDRHWISKYLSFGWLFFPINYSNKVLIGNGWAGNLSVRTTFAKDIGGMDERFEKGAFREESDFCTRLVRKFGLMIFDPDAVVVHLGANLGGLRTFKNTDTVRAQHHFDGFFYYTYKNIPLFQRIPHYISFLKIFYPPGNITSLSKLTRTISRTFKGMVNARRMLKEGPVYLEL